MKLYSNAASPFARKCRVIAHELGLKLEEIRFRETLARGLKLLDEATVGMKEGDRLTGDVAFKLYDTYGFPLDLTRARHRGGPGRFHFCDGKAAR